MKYKNNSSYNKDSKFKKKKRVKDMDGLCVRVYNNNIENIICQELISFFLSRSPQIFVAVFIAYNSRVQPLIIPQLQ